ncbi:hypothetical protein WJX84_007639 [Apatococcus fuscideae]|uniref:Uncharacterized protein n=1 Tax=Apatococcus fuscideae TaxID=2026836 RepID=A0AAW1TDJ6_9CHLO
MTSFSIQQGGNNLSTVTHSFMDVFDGMFNGAVTFGCPLLDEPEVEPTCHCATPKCPPRPSFCPPLGPPKDAASPSILPPTSGASSPPSPSPPQESPQQAPQMAPVMAPVVAPVVAPIIITPGATCPDGVTPGTPQYITSSAGDDGMADAASNGGVDFFLHASLEL